MNSLRKPAWAGDELRLDPGRFPQQVTYASRHDQDGVTFTVDKRGAVTVTLELHHEDSELCVPLLVAHDLADIAADWHSWSEVYNLPMLMIEADGKAKPLDDQLGQIKTRAIKPRRRQSLMGTRRPRFLVRRRTGAMGVRMVIKGDEIIARS